MVNDASTDNTKELIDTYVEQLGDRCSGPKYQVYHNTVRRRKLANLYTVLHTCEPDEIVFLLDGDDWLAHDQVLARINEEYHDSAIWMTFGDYQNNPPHIAKEWGIAEGSYCAEVSDEIVTQLLYRKKPFIYMHPRTFYAWLFHHVQLSDLITERIPAFAGDFFPACNDLAMFFPMVELAGTHVKFINEILYCRNVRSDLVGFKVDSTLQRQAAHEIRRKNPYQPLSLQPRPRQLTSKDLLFIVDNMLLIRVDENKFKTIGHLRNNNDVPIAVQRLSDLFSYCVMLQAKDWVPAHYNSINFEYIIQLLEKTQCPFCLFSQKPARCLLLSESVYAWKRSLNVYLPDVDAYMMSLPDLAQFVQQKTGFTTIGQACNSYINSFQYDVALSIFF